MEKHVRIGLMLDYYSALLTQYRREIMQLYYGDDYSLGEIAETRGISRQAVRDHIMRAQAQLEAFESALGLLDKALSTQDALTRLSAEMGEKARESEPLNELLALWGDGDGV